MFCEQTAFSFQPLDSAVNPSRKALERNMALKWRSEEQIKIVYRIEPKYRMMRIKALKVEFYEDKKINYEEIINRWKRSQNTDQWCLARSAKEIEDSCE